MKYSFIFLSFLLFSCQNYHKKSFNQLSAAFNKWYNVSNSDLHLSDNMNLSFSKYDSMIIEDYILDLKRFVLELSQINYNKLSTKSQIEYSNIKDTIHNLLFDVEIVQPFKYNCSFYIENIYTKIASVYNSRVFSIFDKKNKIVKIINNSYAYLEKSKFIITESYNINNLIIKTNELVNLLYEIESKYYISDVYSSEFILDEYEIFLNEYISWLKENTKSTQTYNIKNIYNYYLKQYFGVNDYDYILRNLDLEINKSFNQLFTYALENYLINNDEPIWVDRTDSLNVIRWTLENSVFSNKITNCDYSNFSNIIFDQNYSDITIDSVDVVSCYDSKQEHLMKEVSAYVNSKYKKNNYYLSKYDINVVINKVSDHVLSQNYYENDSNNDILFYLNLYHRYKQILYQETYLKSSNSIEQIKNDIDHNCFFEDEIKKIYFMEKFSTHITIN